ncbi:hypothetical protein BJ165DRAFT_1487253 [Panaeolus papilionaceus]|nr:hypothetical protein BJ165DRAFT_1487253 [Panaeolus papilionaceus]
MHLHHARLRPLVHSHPGSHRRGQEQLHRSTSWRGSILGDIKGSTGRIHAGSHCL